MADTTESLLQDPNYLQSIGQEIPTPDNTPEDNSPLSMEDIIARTSGGMLPAKPTSVVGEIGKGIAAGARDLYGTAGGLVGLAGDALGNQDVKNFGLGIYQDQQEANQQNNAPAVSSIGEATKSFGNFADYAAYGLAKNITEMVPLLATSEIGGLAAGGLAKEAVERATQYAVKNGIDRAAAEKLVSAAVTRGGGDTAGKSLAALTENATERGMTDEAASSFAKQAMDAGKSKANLAFAGAQAGNAAAMTVQSVGDEYGQTKDVGTAMSYGSAEGLINAAAMGIAAAPIFRKALGISSGEVTKGFGDFAQKFAKRSALDAAVLGGTGYASTDLSQQAEAATDPNYDPNSDEAKAQRMEALKSGALGGFAFGAIGALEGAHAPLTAEVLRALDRKPEPKPIEGDSADSTKTPEPAVGTTLGYTAPGDRIEPNNENWSQPVYVNIDGKRIRMQKDLQENRWVIPDPESLSDDLKSTGLRAVNGNVIIDPKNGIHAADLHMRAENALEQVQNPPAPKDETKKADPDTELSQQTDTSNFVPAPIAEKSAEDSAQAILSGNAVVDRQKQNAAEYELLKRKLAAQQGSEVNPAVVADKNTVERIKTRDFNENLDELGQGQFPFAFSDMKAKESSNEETPRAPETNRFVGGLKEGDQVAFAHPDYGVVRATVDEEIQHHEDDAEGDRIKLSFIDPKTSDTVSQIVPRSSWSRLAPAKAKLPSFDSIISRVTGDNPTPDELQQLGFANITIPQQIKSGEITKPGVSADQVYWDGLGKRPSLGDYLVKEDGVSLRVAELHAQQEAKGTNETSAKSQLTIAAKTGDYSGVTENGLIPVRTIYGAKYTQEGFEPVLGSRSYGLFTGGGAESKAKIDAAKEMTLRQWNMGLPVLAKKGSFIPEGFEAVELPNGMQKITAVRDYMDRTWRRGNTPDSFSVDVPQTLGGARARSSGVGLFDHFYNNDLARIDASEAAHQREAAEREGEISSALKEPLTETESNFFQNAMLKVNDILSRITEWNGKPIDTLTIDRAGDSVKARLIRQMVPPPKEKQTKDNATSRAVRPAWITEKVLPEQAIRNNRVESIFLSSVGHLADMKNALVEPKVTDAVSRAQSQIEEDTRSKEDQRFDPVRKTITGLQASEIAKRAYTSAGQITQAEIRKIVQNIRDTSSDFSEADLTHLNRVSDYYQSLSNKFSEGNVKNLLYRELNAASRRTVADNAFRGADATVSKDNEKAGSFSENQMVLGAKEDSQRDYSERSRSGNTSTLGQEMNQMSHGAPDYVPEHLTHGWEGGSRVLTSDGEDIDPMLGSLEQFDSAWSQLPQDTRTQIRKIGAKRVPGYNSEESKAYRARVAPHLSDGEERVLSREQDLFQKAKEMFDEHLIAKQEVREGNYKKKLTTGEFGKKDPKKVFTPLNQGEQQTMKRALSQLRDILSPNEPEGRVEPNTPLKVDPEAPKETPSGISWTREQESLATRLVRESEARKKAAAEYRARIFAKLGEDNTTQNDVRTPENTPQNASRPDVANGAEALRDSSRDEAQPQGGLGSLASDTAETDYDGGHLGVRGSSDDASTSVRGASSSVGREGSSVGASPSETRSLATGTRRLIVKSAGNLSDEDVAGMRENEIDRAYDALHNTADMRAVHGNETIAGVSPRVEDIQGKSLKELLQGVADEQRAYFENSVRADQIRKNHGDAVKAGIFNSPLEFLRRVAGGKTDASPDAVIRAKALLGKQGKDGYDWNHIATQVGSFRDGTTRAPYGGYITKEGNIYLNLDAAHRGGSILNTYLHELSHAVEKDKVDSFLAGKTADLSSTERSALDRLRNLQGDALKRLYSKSKGADPKATIAKMEKWARDKALASQEKGGNKADRQLYPLSDLHEFIRGIQDDPEFHRFLGDTGKGNLGYGAERAADKGVTYSMSSDAGKALNAITELNTGRKTDPNSPLARAFADSWEVTSSSNGKNEPTKLTGQLRDFNDREQWIKSQVIKRDLHGTSNDRMALRNEWDSMNGKVRKKAAYLPQPRAIELKTGSDIGYREPTPYPREVEPRKPAAETPKVESKVSSSGETTPVATPTQTEQNAHSEGVINAQQRLLSAEDKIQELTNAGKIQMSESGQMMTNDPEAQAAFAERYAATQQLRAELKNSKAAKATETPAATPVPESKAPEKEPAVTNFESPNTQYFDNVTKVPEVRALLKEGLAAIKARAEANPGGGTGFREQALLQELADKRIAAIKESRKAGNRPSAKEPITLQDALGNPDGLPPEPPKETPEPPKDGGGNTPVEPSEVPKKPKPEQPASASKAEVGSKIPVDESKVQWASVRKAALSMDLDSFKKWLADPKNENQDKLNNASDWYKSSINHYTLEDGNLHAIVGAKQKDLKSTKESSEGLGSLGDIIRERVPFGKDLLGEKIGTHNGGEYERGGLLTATNRNLDPRVTKTYNDSVNSARAQESRAELNARRLNQVIKKSYPKGTEIPHERMNTALGNISNYLKDEDVQQIRDTQKASGRKAAEALRQKLLETRRAEYRVKQQEALNSLPPEVSAAITKMTDHIAELQRALSDKNVIDGDLKATVDATGRVYLNRSYQVFDDPKWAEKVMKNHEVVTAASKFFRKQLLESEVRKVMAEARESGTPMSDSEARKIAGSRVTDGMVSSALERVLDVHGDEIDRLFSHGRLPGKKDLSIFDKRGQISEEIQNLWGVNKDPELNYARTVTKMSGLIANHQFLTDLRNIGLNEGWMWNPKAPENEGERAPRGYDKLVTEGNKTLSPLDGMYMKKELGDALYRMFPKNGDDDRPAWLRYMMKLTGWTMGAKTVLSPAAQIRHNLGNPISLISTGNLSLGDILSGKAGDRIREAAIVANPFKSLNSAEKVQAEVEKLHRLGILHQSVEGRLLRELLGDQRNQGQAGYKNVWQKYVQDPLNMVTHTAEKSYEFGDAMYKTAIFYGEKDKYSRAFPGWSEAQVEAKAAQIARDVHWTYDLTPSFTKELSKFPFIAPFIRFTTEVYRTTFNLAKLAHSEITEGIKTDNKELAEIGYQRLRGMATVALGPSLAIASWQAANGFTDEDQESLRKFLPEWQKNSQIFLLNKGDGKVGFYDFSYLDHYKVIREPLIAIHRAFQNSDNAEQFIRDGVIGGVLQAANPYLREQIFAGAAMDIMRNKNGASGAPVYNPQDTPERIGMAIGQHLGQAFLPGALDSANRITKAVTGGVSDSGRSYDLGYEMGSVLGGQRIAQTDVPNALQFKASNFVRNERDASQLFSHEFASRGDRTPDDVVSGYTRANNARMALVQDMRNDYMAAIQLGMSPEQAQQALRGSHLSQDVVDMVVSGQYKQYVPSKTSTSLVQSRGQTDRVQALEQVMKETPATLNLPR